MKSYSLLILSSLAILINSCSKDSDTSGNTNDNNCTLSTQFIVGKWQLEKVETKRNGSYVDLTSQLDSCQKDDYYLFSSNGNYTRVDIGLICSFTIDDYGNWSFVNGKLIIGGLESTTTIVNCNKIITEYIDKYSQQNRLTYNRISK